MRTLGRASWLLLPLHLLLLMVACGPQAREASTGAARCERDREALRALSVAHVACEASEACPSGSRCDTSHHVCVADCFSDSDCRGGDVCQCDGTCAAPEMASAESAVTAPPPVCARDNALLDGLRVPATQRGCSFNDECPLGAYCDGMDRLCRWDCRPGDASSACPAGSSCDCNGQCVGATTAPPALRKGPQLEVRPALSTLTPVPGQSYASAMLTTKLLSSDAHLADPTAHVPSVLVRAPDGFEVACTSATDASAVTGYASRCSLDHWSFVTAQGGGYVAAQTLWVRGTPGVGADTGQLAFSSPELANSLVSVGVDMSAAADATRPPPPFDGAYDGYATLDAAAVPGAGDPSGLVNQRIRVRAVAAQGFVTLLDAGRQLSATGALTYRWNRGIPYDPGANAWAARLVPWIASSGQQLAVRAEQIAEEPALARGQLMGTLRLVFPGPSAPVVTVRFDVRRTGDLVEPACSAGCAAGSFCDASTQRCVPGEEVPLTAGAANTLASANAGLWRSALDHLYEATLRGLGVAALPDAYAAQEPKHDLIAVGPGLRERDFAGNPFLDLGARLCEAQFATSRNLREFPSYVEGATMANGCVAYLPTGLQVETTTLSAKTFCDAIYDVGRYTPIPGWGSICFKRPYAAGEIAQLRKTHAPCVLYDQEPVWNQWSCRRMLHRAMANGYPPTYMEDYLAQCVQTDLKGSSHSIYFNNQRIMLCPVVGAVTGDAGDYAEVQRLACWDKDAFTPGATGHFGYQSPFESKEFTQPTLAISGDLTCASGPGDTPTIPYAAELFTRRDRAIREPGSVTELTTEQLYGSCMDDLTAAPPGLPSSLNPGNTRAAFDALLGGPEANATRHECISPGRFVPMLDAAARSGHPYFQRLVQQWLGVHAFIADEAVALFGARAVLGSAGQPLPAEPPPGTLQDLKRAVDQLDAGWRLVLEPTILARLEQLDGDTLRNPDYRHYYVEDSKGSHEQGIAVPVALLETMAKYLTVVDTLLEESTWSLCYDPAHVVSPADLRARQGAALRTATTLEAVTQQMLDTADKKGLCPEGAWYTYCELHHGTCDAQGLCQGIDLGSMVPWRQRYLAARGELAAARDRLAAREIDERKCENPIGVSDDLPLVYSDQSGANARFFASSEYLGDTWARPAIQAATDSLAAARSAWEQARQSRLQQEETEQQKQDRRAELTSRFGGPVIKSCGLDNVSADQVFTLFDPATAGAMAPDTCYRPQGCSAGDTRAACFRGELGEAALAITLAQKDVELERSRLADHQAAYDSSIRYCATLSTDLAFDDQLIHEHTVEMQELRDRKLTWDIAGDICASATACASGAALSFGASCVASAADAFVKLEARGVQSEMEQADARHAERMAQRKSVHEVAACVQEAEQRYVGIRTAELQIERRLADLQMQLLKMKDLEAGARQSLLEGRAALKREDGRKVPAIAFHYWLDEHIDQFYSRFAWARRLTYMTLLAVEYEFQESLPLRQQLVLARHPAQLEAILQKLQELKLAHRVNGRVPAKTQMVVSLRDDLLGIEDRSGNSKAGERNWSARQRLQERLMSPHYAVYDENGVYLGQGIPFTLKEMWESQWRCAERLDGVTALVSGSALGTRNPYTPLFLYKRNTFTSQWCTGHEGVTPYQVGTVSTPHELFGATAPGGGGGHQSYVSAQLSAWTTKERADLVDPGYVAGRSEELAGRGLYGDYILLFPTPLSPDLNLGNVQDVLLKFDFFSIDDAPTPGGFGGSDTPAVITPGGVPPLERLD